MMNGLKTAALLAALSALLLMIGQALGGQTGLVIAFGITIVMNFGSYWFSDKIVLKMHRAKEVGPDHDLYKITEELAQRAGLPMPKVYIIPSETPTPLRPVGVRSHAAVAATEGILRILPKDELAGVMAHELAHVQHRDILISSVAATVAAAIVMVSRFALFFGGRRNRGANPIVSIAMMILAPLAAMIIKAAISRAREFAADARGAEIAGRPDGLANALRRNGCKYATTPRAANGRGPSGRAHVHHETVFWRRRAQTL